MSRRSARTSIAALVAVALCAVLTVGATSASAGSLRPHYTAKQKAAIHKSLSRQLHRSNGKAIRSAKWLRLAAITDYKLPLTIRLNPHLPAPSTAFAPSNDIAAIDLGQSFGVVNPTLSGALRAEGRFADPFEGGTLGEIDVTVPTGGAPAVNAAGETLKTNPISLLSNSAVTGVNTPNGCANYDYANVSLGGPAFNDAADNWATFADVPNQTVFRTTELALGVSSGGGVANLLNPAADQGARLALNLNAKIWSVFRTMDPGSPLNCLQAITGYKSNNLPAKVLGSLTISPGVTGDGRLRLARISVHGIPTNISVQACLAPEDVYVDTFANPTPAGGGPSGFNPPNDLCNTVIAPALLANGVLPLPPNAESVTLNGNLNVTSLTGEVLIGSLPVAGEASGAPTH